MKAIILAFCTIQKQFIKNNRDKFVISHSLESPNIGQNSDGVISNFQIFSQINCINSRTSDHIDIKLRAVTKLDNRKKKMSKKIGDDVSSKNSNAIVIFLIYSQFGTMRKPDSGHIVCKT